MHTVQRAIVDHMYQEARPLHWTAVTTAQPSRQQCVLHWTTEEQVPLPPHQYVVIVAMLTATALLLVAAGVDAAAVSPRPHAAAVGPPATSPLLLQALKWVPGGYMHIIYCVCVSLCISLTLTFTLALTLAPTPLLSLDYCRWQSVGQVPTHHRDTTTGSGSGITPIGAGGAGISASSRAAFKAVASKATRSKGLNNKSMDPSVLLRENGSSSVGAGDSTGNGTGESIDDFMIRIQREQRLRMQHMAQVLKLIEAESEMDTGMCVYSLHLLVSSLPMCVSH